MSSVQESARTALLGRPDGNRQRMFRKAKATVQQAYFRATPDKIDKPYVANLIKAAGAEFLGLFLFVFLSAGATTALSEVTGGATDAGYTLAVAFAHGITIALTVAITAAWSGGHINPAVTFAFVLSGRLDALAGLVYWVAQLLGGLLGGFFLWTIWGTKWGLASHAFGPHVSVWAGLEVEIFLTFNLVLTVWGTAVDPRGNHTLAPYFIGLAIFVGVLFGAPLTGPSMNPARTFGVAVFTGNFDHHWVYWLGPLLGGAIAGLTYEFAFIRSTEMQHSDDLYEEIEVGGNNGSV